MIWIRGFLFLWRFECVARRVAFVCDRESPTSAKAPVQFVLVLALIWVSSSVSFENTVDGWIDAQTDDV